MDILSIKNLRKAFKDLMAVDGVNLDIEEGEIYGILGPNGAGKSTMMNCILGLMPFDSGTVLYEQKENIKTWNKNIGYVPQELAIYPDLTAIENVRFFASLYGIKNEKLDKCVKEALDFVGLLEVKDKKASEFSGGMKRRLNLACAITHSPKLIIMDEPTVGIDPQSRNRILENVRMLNSKGTTVIYTTHYMPEVEELCSQIAVIDHGKVIAKGTKQEIMQIMGNDEVLRVTFSGDEHVINSFVHEIKKLQEVNCLEQKGNSVRICYVKKSKFIDRLIGLTSKYEVSIVAIINEETKLEDIFLTLTGKELRDVK